MVNYFPTVPEETCTTDCVCPCGWVTEKNYTQEELKEVIVEIQEKLKVEKSKLSSVVSLYYLNFCCVV